MVVGYHSFWLFQSKDIHASWLAIPVDMSHRYLAGFLSSKWVRGTSHFEGCGLRSAAQVGGNRGSHSVLGMRGHPWWSWKWGPPFLSGIYCRTKLVNPIFSKFFSDQRAPGTDKNLKTDDQSKGKEEWSSITKLRILGSFRARSLGTSGVVLKIIILVKILPSHTQ